MYSVYSMNSKCNLNCAFPAIAQTVLVQSTIYINNNPIIWELWQPNLTTACLHCRLRVNSTLAQQQQQLRCSAYICLHRRRSGKSLSCKVTHILEALTAKHTITTVKPDTRMEISLKSIKIRFGLGLQCKWNKSHYLAHAGTWIHSNGGLFTSMRRMRGGQNNK